MRVPFELLVGGLTDGASAAGDGASDPEDKVLWLPVNVTVAARLLSEGRLPGPRLPDRTPPTAA